MRIVFVGLAIAGLWTESMAQDVFATLPLPRHAIGLWADIEILGDVDGDGRSEFLVAVLTGFDASEPGLVAVVSPATEQPLHVALDTAGLFGRYLAVLGDVDADGRPDFAIGATGFVRIVSGVDGAEIGTLTSPIPGDVFGPEVSGLFDIDGDAVCDLGVHGTRGAMDYVRVYSGATRALLSEFLTDDDILRFAGVGDTDGDEIPDIALLTEFGHRLVLWSGADGATLLDIEAFWMDGKLGDLDEVGDVDGDGFADVLVGGADVFKQTASGGHAAVYSGVDGSVIHLIKGEYENQQLGSAVAGVGDMDSDGTPDFAVGVKNDRIREWSEGSVRVYSGATGGLHLQYVGGAEDVHLGLSLGAGGDFDADGTLDIISNYDFLSGVRLLGGGVCAGAAVRYGQGVAGSGGIMPRLEVVGCPAPGLVAFLDVHDGLGGATGQLFIGARPAQTPYAGGVLLLEPLNVTPHVLLGDLDRPGTGTRRVEMFFPFEDSLSDTSLFAQAAYLDSSADGGVSMTPGLRLTIQ